MLAVKILLGPEAGNPDASISIEALSLVRIRVIGQLRGIGEREALMEVFDGCAKCEDELAVSVMDHG